MLCPRRHIVFVVFFARKVDEKSASVKLSISEAVLLFRFSAPIALQLM